jgi:hypothetical protein
MTAMRREWPRLVKDVAAGTCAELVQLPSSLARVVVAAPDRSRAMEIDRAGPDAVHRLWPKLGVISCWADGQAGPAASTLSRSLPGITLQPKGLLATEGVISIPFRGHHPLAVRSHFLEFEEDGGQISLAADLKANRHYSVLLTNGGGLFRYRLHDLIEVDGWVGATPSIRFIGKAGIISDRMGEKLSDAFVCSVLRRLFANRPPAPSFSMLAPDAESEGCRYTLYVDVAVSNDFGTDLDALLRENPHYDHCRRLGQLCFPRIFEITGDAFDAYSQRLQEAGLRLGDIKPVGLSRLDGWSDYFKCRI